MPRFLIERIVGNLTPEQIEAGSRRSIEVLIVDVRRRLDPVLLLGRRRKDLCEDRGAKRRGDLEHARQAGLPANSILEISLEISPAMFR